MKLANIPSDIKRTARELKIPVLQHHIYVNGRHKHVTISKMCSESRIDGKILCTDRCAGGSEGIYDILL